MSHPLSPKEKAQDLWAKQKDLAEREGGLLDASVVELFTEELEAWKKDLVATTDGPTDIVDWDDVGWTYYGGQSLATLMPDEHKVWHFVNTGFTGWTCDIQRLIDANPQWTFHIRKSNKKAIQGTTPLWELKAIWDACTREWWQQNYDPKADYDGSQLVLKMFEKGMFGPRKLGVF